MREILFRGKRKSGPWCYGDLLNYDDVYKTIINKEDECIVIPETIGQYTGLKDKNGKMIFEGDILRSIHYRSQKKNYYIKHICEWSKKYSGWFMRHSEHAGNVEPDYRHGDIQSFVYFNNAKQPEIIGNIYDNTELLK